MSDIATSESSSGRSDADNVVQTPFARSGADAPGGLDTHSSIAHKRRTFSQALSSVTLPQAVMAIVVIGYSAYFAKRSIDIHHSLGTSSYDSALYDQGLWLLSRFEAPFVTLMGRNLFGDHSSFILLLLVPLYWLWPSAGILFISQSIIIGAGAVPIFLYGRTRLHSEWAAVLIACCYLIHPTIGWTNLENFHPDSFLGAFIGFALWAALSRRWKTYIVFVVLALSVKEDAALVIIPLGAWVALRRDRRIGLLTMAGSIAFAAFAMLVVMRRLNGVATRNGWRIPFDGPSGFIKAAFQRPSDVLAYFRSEDRPWYLVQMTAPFAWLFFRKPAIATISSLVLFTNILSTYWYQHQVEFHYSLIAVPALSFGTVAALGEIRERRPVGEPDSSARAVVPARHLAIATVVVAALFTSYLWSAVPWGRTPQFYGDRSSEWARSGHAITEMIPDDAIVAAHYRITPHIAYRREIYQFPTPFRAVLYGSDGNVDGPRVADRAERVEYVVLSTNAADSSEADWAVIESAFKLVDENSHWRLYRRDFEIPLPPESVASS